MASSKCDTLVSTLSYLQESLGRPPTIDELRAKMSLDSASALQTLDLESEKQEVLVFWKPLHTTQSNDTQSTESQESVESEKNDENNAELQKRLQALQKRYHVLLSQHRRKERERQNTRTRIKRIKRLHQYNAAKDAAHELFGKIAELESVRVIDLYERFGIEDV